MLKKKLYDIQVREFFRIFADVVARRAPNLESSWNVALASREITRKINQKMLLCSLFSNSVNLNVLSSVFARTGMSIAQSKSQLLRASESLYLISTSFFYTSRSTWHTTECRNTTCSIYAVIAFVVYVATIRHVRSRTSQLNSYIDRRNAILIAIYCQNQSANLRGVIDHAIPRCYLTKIFTKWIE